MISGLFVGAHKNTPYTIKSIINIQETHFGHYLLFVSLFYKYIAFLIMIILNRSIIIYIIYAVQTFVCVCTLMFPFREY